MAWRVFVVAGAVPGFAEALVCAGGGGSGRASVGLGASRAGLVATSELEEASVYAMLDDASVTRSGADGALESLKERGLAPTFRSAELQPVYDVSLAQLRTTTRCRGDLADAVGALGGQSVEKLAVLFFCVFASSALTAVASLDGLAFLPEIARFTVVQLLCFAPYGYLSLGLALPEEL